MPQPPEIDFPKAIREFAKCVFDNLSGMVVSGMIYLGHHLGLYTALHDAGPITSEELAAKTGLHERWVREWLRGQAAAGLLDYDGEGRFVMSPIAALVLANERSPAFAAGAFAALPQQIGCARAAARVRSRPASACPYDAFGPRRRAGVEGMLAPWFRTMLVPIALPRLDGVVAKLEAGARVADIGCGTGVALIEMAKAYPRSQFHGYDISVHAIAHAAVNRREAGLT